MKWLDGKRLVFPQGALEHLQVNGVALIGCKVCVSGKLSKANLSRSITNTEVRSREQQPVRSEAPKGLLKFPATLKVLGLIETQMGAVFKKAVQTVFIEYHSGVSL